MKLLKKLFGKGSEEVHFSYEEKRYPFGVLVLLFMMTVVVWMLGQRAMYDVRDVVPRIEYPRYFELSEERAVEMSWETNVWPLHQKRNALQLRISELRTEYDSSLLENIADKDDRLYGGEDLIHIQLPRFQKELEELNTEIIFAEAEHEKLQEIAREARRKAEQEYRNKNKWYQAKVFGLEALFWVPFFFLTLAWHTRSKRKRSRWEVISLSSLISATLLSIQSIVALLWSWIPRYFFEWLWKILSATLFTRIIGYYLMVGLAIFLFGGFIIFIHKRMTDPVRGGRKKIRQGYCPTCSYPLNLSTNHCGGCGKQLKEQCASCGNGKYTWEAVCTHCGTK